MLVDDALVQRLYGQANATRWRLSIARFAHTLEASATRGLAGKGVSARVVERYLASLHLDDLALACACAEGDEAAWEHFVREQRPVLYRAADALGPNAREIADSLYADLYGLKESDGARQSLFRYFHGRSSLATWLRAVLAQRHIDRLRAERRVEPLPDENTAPLVAPPPSVPDEPDRSRYLLLMRRALEHAVSQLNARDRLRLGCYYAQELTLAQTGRLLREHEATVSRNLARTRRAIRLEVERQLERVDGMNDAQIARCFECVVEDPGALDLADLIGHRDRKKPEADRSEMG